MATTARRQLTSAGPGLVRTPFTILVDKAEKAAFQFSGIRARSFVDREMREYLVQCEPWYLGIGRGDYSLEGYEGRIGIERKSMADFQGTLLGWPTDADTLAASGNGRWEIDRRGRFKRELATLEKFECKAVIVEATLGQCISECPQWGVRTSAENGKYLASTFIAWQQKFRVPWILCDDRRMAELTAFRILEQFWARQQKERQRAKRELARPLFDN